MPRERLFLLAGFFLGSFGWNVCWPFLPLRVQEVGVGGLAEVARISGYIAGGSNLITAMLAPWWSMAGERWGFRRQVIRAHLGMGTAMGAIGLARVPLELVGAGALLGMLGGNYPHYMALVAMRAAPNEVGRVIGDLQAAGQLGATLGPLLGGAIASQFGVPLAFFTATAISFGAALMIATQVTPDRGLGRARGESGGLRDALRDPRTRWLMAILVVGDAGIQGLRPLIPIVIATRTDDPGEIAAVTGVVATMVTGGGILSALTLGRAAKNIHPRRILVVSLPVACLFAAAIPFATTIPLLVGVWTLLGIAGGSISPCVFAWMGRNGAGGSGFALLASTSMLGFAIGPALMGQLTVYGLDLPFYGAAALAGATIALIALYRDRAGIIAPGDPRSP